MQVIPVIDLKHSEVVHARKGERENYRRIETPLSPTARPVDVAAGFMNVYPFSTLYIADLDAIAGEGENSTAILEIALRFPHLELWVDCGLAEFAAAAAWLDHAQVQLVLGSECQKDAALLATLSGNQRTILSVDFNASGYLGPAELSQSVALWPPRVIVMTMDRVGSGTGPDLQLLRMIRAMAGGRKVFAAGGVRGIDDLRAVAQIGVNGALVATALHSGDLTGSDVARLAA